MIQKYTTTRHVTVERHPVERHPIEQSAADWTGGIDTLIRETEKLMASGRKPKAKLKLVEAKNRIALPGGSLETVNDDGLSRHVLIDGLVPRDLASMFLRIAAAYPGASADKD